MRSLEIDAGGKRQVLPFNQRQVLGTTHGLPEGALELEPHREGAVLIGRAAGVRIGTMELPPGSRRLICVGQSVRVGEACVTLAEQVDAAPQTRQLAQAMLAGKPLAVRPGVPSLLWLNGPDLGRRVILMEEATFIGRGEGCAARVQDALASRMHAKLVRTGSGFKLLDLMSANGVRVDGEPVAEARALQGGEVIQVGNTLLAFERPPAPREPAATPAAVAAKPEPKQAAVPADDPQVENTPARPRPRKVTAFEAGLVGVAVFAVGACAAVITWALR